MAGSARSLNSLRSPGITDRRQISARQAAPAGATASSAAGGNYSVHSVGELSENMRIEHAKFGGGLIVKIDSSGPDARITVKFDSTDERTLMLKFAKFAIVG